MRKTLPFLWTAGLAAMLLWFTSACDNGGSSGSGTPNVGSNDVNTVMCVGDSITDGECAPAGAPYPSRLAGLSGKNVVNQGVCGSKTDTGASRMKSRLARYKPGYVCILYGINDIDFGHDDDSIMANLRSMVVDAQNNQSIVLLATLTPTYDSHAFARQDARRVNGKIRDLAHELGARLVDLEMEFGTNRDFIQEDGLHPSDSGTALIALSFNDKI